MNTSDRQKDIITAAFALISEQGIQELTIKKIAQSIGISEPAIYRHFNSKAEILDAIVEEMITSRNGTLAVLRTVKMDTKTMLSRFFTEQALMFTVNPSMTIMLFSEDIFRNNPALQEKITVMMDETRAFIHTLLKKGIAEKVFRKTIDPETVALMLIGGFRLLVSSWHLGAYATNLEKRTDDYIRLSLPLIVPDT